MGLPIGGLSVDHRAEPRHPALLPRSRCGSSATADRAQSPYARLLRPAARGLVRAIAMHHAWVGAASLGPPFSPTAAGAGCRFAASVRRDTLEEAASRGLVMPGAGSVPPEYGGGSASGAGATTAPADRPPRQRGPGGEARARLRRCRRG